MQLVSSMVCSIADTPPSADAVDAVATTLDVAFGVVGQPLGHLIELVDWMSTCDEKSPSNSRKGATGSVGEEASMQVRAGRLGRRLQSEEETEPSPQALAPPVAVGVVASSPYSEPTSYAPCRHPDGSG